MELDERTLTVQAAAEFLQTTEEGVLALIHSGQLIASNVNVKPNAQRPRWRILASDLGRFLLKTRHTVEQPRAKQKRAKSAVKDYFQ